MTITRPSPSQRTLFESTSIGKSKEDFYPSSKNWIPSSCTVNLSYSAGVGMEYDMIVYMVYIVVDQLNLMCIYTPFLNGLILPCDRVILMSQQSKRKSLRQYTIDRGKFLNRGIVITNLNQIMVAIGPIVKALERSPLNMNAK